MIKKSESDIFSGLTFDQRKSLESFTLWLENKNNFEPFVLSGYAGSGKTFLSIKFLRAVEKKKLCWTVVAPTHKAVDVLRQAIDLEGVKPTWYPSTIQRLLRLKLKRKGESEVCERTDQTANSLNQLGFVLIDEASMIGTQLLEIILECAHYFNTRLVFVGDPAQLPPVGEVESPVFSISRARKSLLKEVIRHQGPVLHLATNIREESLPCVSPPSFNVINPKKGFVQVLEYESWLEKAILKMSSSLESDKGSSRILCYTNRVLERLVPHARRAILGEVADQSFVLPGEILISRKAVMKASSIQEVEIVEESGMIISSNREMIVKNIESEYFHFPSHEYSDKINFELPAIQTIRACIECSGKEFLLRLLPPIGSESRIMIDDTLQRLSSLAKNSSSKDRKGLWRTYFIYKDSFASLGPSSVLTVHRSQGSTFDEVFIAPDVFWPSDLNLRRQLVYVAISRARNGVSLVANKNFSGSNAQWLEKINFD